jgi:hypothetical protein
MQHVETTAAMSMLRCRGFFVSGRGHEFLGKKRTSKRLLKQRVWDGWDNPRMQLV